MEAIKKVYLEHQGTASKTYWASEKVTDGFYYSKHEADALIAKWQAALDECREETKKDRAAIAELVEEKARLEAELKKHEEWNKSLLENLQERTEDRNKFETLVEEERKLREQWKDSFDAADKKNDELEAEVERFKAALEKVYTLSNQGKDYSAFKIAKQALSGGR